jgi:hypothetical protein
MLVTTKQVGLKRLPIAGGSNIGLVDSGRGVGLLKLWQQVNILDGPLQDSVGWLHSIDIAAQQETPVFGIYTINTAAGSWREDWASGQLKAIEVPSGIIGRFQPWTGATWSNWDTPWANDALRTGTLLLISWEARNFTIASAAQPTYSNSAVCKGVWDDTLITWLKAAGAWGKPFLLRFFWEGNGLWYPWAAGANGNTPGSYIDAFRHVARLVRQYAPNARILWNVGTSGSGWLPLEDCYPGDAYCDYTSLDFYNTGTQPGGWSKSWQPFVAVKPWYDRIIALAPSKSIVVAETGCVPQGGDKAGWYAAIPSALALMPAIRAVVAFDNKDPSGMDFRVTADPTVYAVWKSLIKQYAGEKLAGSS